LRLFQEALITPTVEDHFLFPTKLGYPALEMQIQVIEQELLRSIDPSYAQQVMNVAYIAGAVTYHCNQLVTQYEAILNSVTDNGSRLDLFSDDFVYSRFVSPYYEFEALVTAVVRAYNTIRFPLWSAFGTSGTAPNNFERVVKVIDLPQQVGHTFEEAVLHCEKAKMYRDCIQHYAHFGARLPFTRVQLLNGIAWSVLALLPDNPEDKSYNSFLYEKQIDALTYGWELTNDLLYYLTVIIESLPARSEQI
jgi:hypothetical protein